MGVEDTYKNQSSTHPNAFWGREREEQATNTKNGNGKEVKDQAERFRVETRQ